MTRCMTTFKNHGLRYGHKFIHALRVHLVVHAVTHKLSAVDYVADS
jgi:hypothetical protein